MSNLVQARGVKHRDAVAALPFMDGSSSKPQGTSNRGVVAVEVLDDVYSSHMRESTVVDIYVNPRRPAKVFSGKQASTLVYRAMENKNRRLGRVFNGYVIRELRLKREGLSQERLAVLVGTTKANISKWERSTTYIAISYDMFMALAKALYVPPEELAMKLSEPTTHRPSAPAIPGVRKRR
jgi:Helix-turn-helix